MIDRTVGIKVVDLFCGCGGMSLGFQNAGFEIIASYDNWEPAINVYKSNFNHPIYQRDLSDASIIPEICNMHPDIIIGGPPCQDFSSAGHRDESRGRAKLSDNYCEIILNSKPKYFVMENVPRIRESETFQKIVEKYKKAGYGLTITVLDASHCGVPQARKRVFIIGGMNENDSFLESTLLNNLSKKQMTVRDYLGDSLGVQYYFRIPRSYNRRAIFSIDEPSVTIRAVERPIPKNYNKHSNDPVDIGPNVRSLTVLERSYIQTFPTDFTFFGTKTDLNTMIGNAVPVKMAEYVANCLKTYYFNNKIENF